MSRQPNPAHPRAWVEVDLGALRRNGAALASRARVPLLAVIKADGYGLGAVRVARALEPLEPWGFGVAAVAEGIELRDAGVSRPILVLSPVLPDEYQALRTAKLRPSLGSANAISRWAAEGGGPWHLAIDTGMNRAGMRWTDVATVHDLLRDHVPEGAYTHFHSADTDNESVREQVRRFQCVLDALPARPRYLHAENSPAIERSERSPWDLARPGVFLYGVGGGSGATMVPEPVVHLRARVIDLRTVDDGETVSYGATWRAAGRRRIATLGIGYADGYRRALSNRGVALVRGKRVPIAGIVTMDMIMLDVTDVRCELGDVATLLGRDGDDLLTVDAVADTAQMLSYELLVGLKLRVPRVYVDDAERSSDESAGRASGTSDARQ
jgi:alanine racemase